MNIIETLEKEQLRSDIPDFAPGDTVRVHAKIVEGSRERIQMFEGVVISRQGMRKEAGAGIPAEVLNLYQKTLKKCGGVAVCELKENACSACRTEFEVAKLHSIKDEAPLTVCPTCGRLMIVEE